MTLYSVMVTNDTPMLIDQMMQVFFPDAKTVLDVTYGNGAFWKGLSYDVTGLDVDPDRAKDVCADFQRLPFSDDAFDITVFDPPYHTDMGRGKASVMGGRFGTFPRIIDLHSAVRRGANEAMRVGKIGALIKVQDYCHASKIQWMPDWVKEVLGDPYDSVIQVRQRKIVDPKWGAQLTAYRNHAVFLAYRKDGVTHKRRKIA